MIYDPMLQSDFRQHATVRQKKIIKILEFLILFPTTMFILFDIQLHTFHFLIQIIGGFVLGAGFAIIAVFVIFPVLLYPIMRWMIRNN